MIKIWADCLIAGTKKWDEVKALRREAVRAELERRVEAGVLSQENFNAILGIEPEPEAEAE